MQIDELLALTDLKKVKEALARELLNNNSWVDKYRWLKSPTISTDKFVGEFLDSQMASPLPALPDDKFDSSLFENHLKEASSLLDLCISRRAQIYSLEAEAITSALGYMVAESLQPGELALSEIALKATRKQADATATDADESILITQDRVKKNARDLKMKMHSTEGHPLNYGEQIDFLRTLYADNIRSIYERLAAARMGLWIAGSAQMRELEKWDKDSSGNLLELINWAREAIRAYEGKQRHETTYTKVFLLGAMDIYPGGQDALIKDMKAGRLTLKFPLEPKHFPMGVPRILQLGISIAFKDNANEFNNVFNLNPYPKGEAAEPRARFSAVDDWHRAHLRQFSFSGSVELPKQTAQLGKNSAWSWEKGIIKMEGEIGAWSGFPERFAGSNEQILNTNPIGEWTITLDNLVVGPEGSRGGLSSMAEGANYILWNVNDLILFMRVATIGD